MPITWHNINAPSMAGVSRGFTAAGDGITAGFDRLASTLSTYEAGAQALKERTDQGLVLDLKTALSNAKTPEQVQALQGQLQDITSRLTTNKGREGVLGAEDARMSAVEKSIVDNNAFKLSLRNTADADANFAARDGVNAAQTLIASGGSLADASKLVPLTVPNRGQVIQQLLQANQGTQRFSSEMSTAENERTNATSNAAATTLNAQTGVTNSQTQQGMLEVSRQQARTQEVDSATRNLTARLASLATLSGAGGGSVRGAGGGSGNDFTSQDGGASNLASGLALIYKGDPGKAEVMGRLANVAMTNPDPAKAAILRELPPDVVLRIVQSHGDSVGTGKYNPFDMGAASRIQQDLLAAAENPSVKLEMQTIAAKRADSLVRAQQAQGMRDDLISEIFPNTFKAGNAPATRTPPPTQTDAQRGGNTADSVQQPVDKSIAIDKALTTRLDSQIQLERDEINAGVRKEFSPEIQKYIKSADADTARSAGNSIVSGGVRLGAAFNDLFTLPIRAAGGATNTLIRGANAVTGANIPFIPDRGMLSSLTPYSDNLNAVGAVEDLKRRRADFEKELAAAKKAK